MNVAIKWQSVATILPIPWNAECPVAIFLCVKWQQFSILRQQVLPFCGNVKPLYPERFFGVKWEGKGMKKNENWMKKDECYQS
jgi:hypothetical protein